MFLHLSVSYSVHTGTCVWQDVCDGGVCNARGMCIVGAMRGRQGMCGSGACVVGDEHAGETATEAGGTHPTGMCLAGAVVAF